MGNKGRAVIIPTFNEEKTIAATIEQIPAFYDIVVVDGFSTDRTVEIANKLAEVINRDNPTYSSGVLCGLQYCRDYDQVIVMDAESHTFADIESHLDKACVVAGKRIEQNKPGVRKIISRLGWSYVNHQFETDISDVSNGFRAYCKEFVNYLLTLQQLPKAPSYAFNATIAIQSHGWEVHEFPMSYIGGKSGLNIEELQKATKWLMAYNHEIPKQQPTIEEVAAYLRTMHGCQFDQYILNRRIKEHGR